MRQVFSVVKACVFLANLGCLLCSVGTLIINAHSLETSQPNTQEHTYYIVNMILASLVGMCTIFGCYGVIMELFGVNAIYICFLLVLLLLQLLQLRSFQLQLFHSEAVNYLERAWLAVHVQPHFMHMLQIQQQCCALNGVDDYKALNLTVPSSCLGDLGCRQALQLNYHSSRQGELISKWVYMTLELFSLACTTLLVALIYKRSRPPHIYTERTLRFPEQYHNYMNSRTPLLSS